DRGLASPSRCHRPVRRPPRGAGRGGRRGNGWRGAPRSRRDRGRGALGGDPAGAGLRGRHRRGLRGMTEMTFGQAVRAALREEMLRDERVFLLGEDIGVYGGAFGVTDGMLAEFGPDRVRDTPISEAAIAGAAIGAALGGLRPVAEFRFFDVILLAMDQLVNQAAKIRYMFGGTVSVPLVVRGPAGS